MNVKFALRILTIVVGASVIGNAHGQTTVEPRQLAAGMATRGPNIETCSPAPCVVPPMWPSSSLFTLNAAIAADPSDPRRLLLGNVDSECSGGSPGFYLSPDSGSKWYQRCLPVMEYKGDEYVPIGESNVGFDLQGAAYELGSYQIVDDFRANGFLAFQKSTDGGRSWTAPTPLLGDRYSSVSDGRLVIDTNPASPRSNALYVSAILHSPIDNPVKEQVVVSHSYDGGGSWIQVPVAPEQKLPAEDGVANLAVGPDGSLYVAWIYCATYPAFCGDERGHVVLSKSIDGGNTWSEPKIIFTVTFHEVPNATHVGHTIPVIAVDNSFGPNAGDLYIAMYTWTGTSMRVGVVRSSDGGSTWSKPVPVAPGSDNHDQFFPWISVSPDGLVGVSWMDRRNDPANTLYQAYAAISRDGGQTFESDVQLTTGFSDPNRGGEGNGWIGDYTGNTWAGSNYFVAAWMDNSQTDFMVDVVGGIRLK